MIFLISNMTKTFENIVASIWFVVFLNYPDKINVVLPVYKTVYDAK